MDQINAKRDARRRRILENSERRLLKISGRNGHAESEDTSSRPLLTAAGVEENNLEPNTYDIITDRCIKRTSNRDDFKSEDAWNDIPTASETRSIDSTLSSGLNFQNVHSRYNEMHEDHPNQSNVTDTRPPVSVQSAFLPYVLLSNRLNYVLLAIIVNVLLILRMDHLFGKTITIPCFTMILGRLYAYESMQEMQESSLLFAALILCNIKPGLTYKIKKFVTVVNLVLGDLALYIFSFTLIYCGFSYCLYNTDILFTINS